MNKTQIGNIGEQVALERLEQLDFTILQTNYRNIHSKGEIDIIALKENILHIIEVKLRKKGSLVNGFEAVQKKKQDKLREVTDLYTRFDCEVDYMDIQFDIAWVIQSGNSYETQFLFDAFSHYG